MEQLGLLSWAPPAPPKRAARAGGREVDPRVRAALLLVVSRRHAGREHAAAWVSLLEEIQAEGVAVANVRRLQEAAEDLRAMGEPVVGISGDGVFYALEAAEVEAAWRESGKRARKTLIHRRQLRTIWKRMLGQVDLGEGRAA